MTNKNDIWQASASRYELTTDDSLIVDEGELFSELSPNILTPKEIVSRLDKYVVGQDAAKRSLAVSVFNRLLALSNTRNKRDLPFEKHNLLFIGNTGCGKTHLIRSLCKALSIPISVQDATTFTSAGYVGRNVEECLEDLMRSAKEIVDKHPEYKWVSHSDKQFDIQTLGEHGVVFLDEIDKLRASGGTGKDVNGKSVQESLLKLVEGKDADIRVDGYSYKVDTSKILFVISGAFSGMTDVIQQRSAKSGIGFGAQVESPDKKALLRDTTVADLTSYGMIPELVGRFPGLAVLDDLDRETLIDIFIKPSDSVLKQITNEFKSFGVSIGFEKKAIEYIVDESLKLGVGARSLRSTTYRMLQPVIYQAASNPPDKTIAVTKQLLEQANGS